MTLLPRSILLALSVSLSLSISLVFATNVAGVRDVPERIVHSRSHPAPESPEMSAASQPRQPIHLIGVVPDTRVRLRTDYIKEFLAFLSLASFRALGNPENAPLKTKFTNLERILSDETDLRTWTRFIVENDRDEDFTPADDSTEAECIDLKIDEFIEYLVEHRGFCAEELQFLHETDGDYDAIDEELSEIKARQLEMGSVDAYMESGATRLTVNALTWVLPLGLALL